METLKQELSRFESEIMALRRGAEGQRAKPHKLALLLAVLDLADEGLLEENAIAFDGRLLDRFARYFDAARAGNDWLQIAPPFFHLKSAPFWFHQPKAGREKEYALLKTSGGGTKRIRDNIEHAFLAPYAFAVLQDARARQQIRQTLISLLAPDAAREVTTLMQHEPHKLGTAFHESFRLVRPALSQLLRVVAESDERKITFDDFREQTQLGTNHIKAMRRYAFGAGLFDEREKLTAFGRAVSQNDPALSKTATQWIMHYFLTVTHGSGPLFWAELVESFFQTEGEIIGEAATKQLEKYDLAQRTLKTTATIFLGTYSEPDALGALDILRAQGDGLYHVNDEFAPRSAGVVACALSDFWAARFGTMAKVNLSDVSGPQGLGRTLMLSTGELNRTLGALQQAGLVRLERATPPHQIARAWDGADALWERLYEL